MRILSAALLLLFAFEATVKAQLVNPKKVDKVQFVNPKAEIVSGSEKVVKGAPFSADAISESVQFLFDGNRITQRVNTRLYRDGDGRFRRDEMPKPIGIGSFVEMPQVIFILDPVSSVKFYLYPESKTARQLDFKTQKPDWRKQTEELEREIEKVEEAEKEIKKNEIEYEKARQEFEKQKQQPGYRETGKESLEIERLKRQIENRKTRIEARKQHLNKRKQLIESWQKTPPNWQPANEKQSIKQAQSESNSESRNSVTENEKPAKDASKSKTVKMETKPEMVKPATKPNPLKAPAKPNAPNIPSPPVVPKGEVKNEALGTRRIEGVEAEGVRQTTTVPAGAIGNERAIEIVYERWYSKELELIVLSKYTDPRFGEQTYRLTNIKRSEPDSTLFTPPADYQIFTGSEKKMPKIKMPRMTMPRKKPART